MIITMLMILYGINRFARNEYLDEYLSKMDVEPEHLEGEAISVNDLASLTQGQSLFYSERIIIMHDLSENSDVWSAFAERVSKTKLETNIILLEDKLDKRKAATKSLLLNSKAKEFSHLKDGDIGTASSWLVGWGKVQGINLEREVANEIVARVGFDQGMLSNELRRLSVLGDVSLSVVNNYTPDKIESRVFSVLEAALRGERRYVAQELNTLRQLAEPYQFMGLLSSQIFQFMAIHFSGVALKDISSGLKLNSYAVQSANRVDVDRDKVRYASTVLASADFSMKTTGNDPWDTIELAVIDIALK